jgi:hypothetical protein
VVDFFAALPHDGRRSDLVFVFAHRFVCPLGVTRNRHQGVFRLNSNSAHYGIIDGEKL